jgi:hypothetical protein
MSEDARATSLTLAGLFLITLATMTLELLLTRIFSVTMWYHFAFVAISLAMFGMTVGALQVYRDPKAYDVARAKQQMARSALWFAVTAVGSVLAHVLVPFRSQPVLAVLWIMLTYILLSFPFYFSGICVCVALTKFSGSISQLYAADLVGAGSGCVLLIYVLAVTDGPTAVVFVAFLGCLAALLLAADSGLRQLQRTALILSASFALIAISNTLLAQRNASLLRVTWAKGEEEMLPLYEKWNSFSRITVRGDPSVASKVVTEGISITYPKDRLQRQLDLRIDSDAETTLTALDGGLPRLDYLKYDVKNVVHYLRSNASVLIIGSGGGRDVLSALLFGQRTVCAVEINPNILDTVNRRFGVFTGHLDRNPKVTFVNDEARSYIARTDERFDIIEASFIDTWAATAAGALTLAENSLYTVNAWKLFLNRLTPQGVLSFSRWYLPKLPAEAYRLTSLAAATLRASGVADPRSHILLVRNLRHGPGGGPIGAATILVSKAPFSSADIDRFEEVSKQLQFDVVLSPRFALDTVFAALANGQDADTIVRLLPLDISAPTDDSPFFFYMRPLRNPLHLIKFAEDGSGSYVRSGGIVVGLLVFVTLLTVIVALVPTLRTVSKEALHGVGPHVVFFGGIGLGFMLIEISQMQRLIVFLGHPTYALSVVLFALLLSSGLGSYTTRKISNADLNAFARLLLLLLTLLVFGLVTPRATSALASSMTTVRIAVAIGILFPLGLFMGMALPLGLKLAANQHDDLAPALWAVNGSMSICGSVLAVAIAMNAGISSTFWCGFCCYAVAFCAYVWTSRSSRSVWLGAAPGSRSERDCLAQTGNIGHHP